MIDHITSTRPTASLLMTATKVVKLSPTSRPEEFSWCYVRYKGTVRPTTVKFFYTEDTRWVDFVSKVQQTGTKVVGIEFPTLGKKDCPVLLDELKSAELEGRIVW